MTARFTLADERMTIAPDPLAVLIDVVARHHDLSPFTLRGHVRTRDVAEPRQLAMLIAHEMGLGGYPKIGRAFRRDHTTVMHGVQAARRRLDAQGRAKVESIKAEVEREIHVPDPIFKSRRSA
ncbi:MAG: helix-turn-helix domain-containing protein [Leptolyngbyaceae bacterium]|nr:helix-turn-helix domain-containing protein [Leptolyngbyaceae bacterium]